MVIKDTISKSNSGNDMFHSFDCADHENCEFFQFCYGNPDTCIKNDFESILKTLTSKEREVLKTLYGYDSSPLSREELSKKINVPADEILEIEEIALGKLRKFGNATLIKKHCFAAFSCSADSFYSLIIERVFGGIDNETSFAIKSGLDLSVISNPNLSVISVKKLKQTMNWDVHEVEALQPYFKYLDKIGVTTLNHLLHTSRKKLLYQAFDCNDALYFRFVKELNGLGYKLKGDPVQLLPNSFFCQKLEEAIIDDNVYAEMLDEFPLELSMLLFKHKISTVEDLVNQAREIQEITEIPPSYLEKIDSFLISKGLVATYCKVLNEGEYLTKKHFKTYINNLVSWLISNNHSVFELTDELKKKSLSLYSATEYISKKYVDFKCEVGKLGELTIEELDLSVRTYNLLKRAKIDMVAQLVEKSKDELLQIPRFTTKNLEEISTRLHELGFSLGTSSTLLYKHDIFSPFRSTTNFFITSENVSILNDVSVDDVCCFIWDEHETYLDWILYSVQNDDVLKYKMVRYWGFTSTSDQILTEDLIKYYNHLVEDGDWNIFNTGVSQKLYVAPKYVNQIMNRCVTPYIGAVIEYGLSSSDPETDIAWRIKQYTDKPYIR